MERFDGETLDDLLRRMTIVKSNDVRCVGYARPFYIKLDRRAGHGFSCEMKAARLAEKYRIPCVEHLACGRCAQGNYLVTREFPDTQPVSDCFAARPPSQEELNAFADFARQVREAPVWHNDFHLGNILYSEKEKRFVLVDLRSFRRRTLWDNFRGYDMDRVVPELRQYLPDAPLLEAIRRYGIRDAEAFFFRVLRKEAEAKRILWPKRREQILHGYWKYTRENGPVLWEKSASADTLSLAETETGSYEELEKRFCASFALDLSLIPCRKAAAWDRRAGKIYYLPAGGAPATEEESRDFQRRLDMTGIPVPEIRWSKGSDGLVRFTGKAEA